MKCWMGRTLPVSDCMTAQGALTAWTAQPDTLSAGSTYILSAQSLSAGSAAALAARNTPGSAQSLVQTAGTLPRTDTVLCLVSLHYLSPSDGEEYTLNYYLQVFESVIIPSDVPSGAWYYDAVEYVLERGLFSGTDEDSFSPGRSGDPGSAGPDPVAAGRLPTARVSRFPSRMSLPTSGIIRLPPGVRRRG